MKEDKREDGKEYYKIKKFDYKYLPIEKVYFTFKNLFNGDRAKGKISFYIVLLSSISHVTNKYNLDDSFASIIKV